MAFFTRRAKEHNESYEKEFDKLREVKPKRITKCDRALQYMQDFGSITTLDAFRDLGDARLSDTIFRLRNMGYNIISEDEKSKNRYGDVVYYARYSLKSK